MKLKKIKSNAGFTLVETLVAVTLLVIASLGPLAIAAQGIASAGYARDQITAYYLAQEGIEYIRNIRDANSLQAIPPTDWLSILAGQTLANCVSPKSCTFSSYDAVTTPVNPVECDDINLVCSNLYTNSNGYYVNTSLGNTTTVFKRIITITSINVDQAQILVTVSWTSRNNKRTFTLKENIYNTN